jgi:hypothetical protein
MGGRQGRLLRLAAVAVLALVAGLLVLVISSATGNRVRETEDPFRERTYETAGKALREPPAVLLRGQGVGALWPWYAEDAERSGWVGRDTDVAFWHHTRFGPSMVHPHSLPLWLAVEFGLPGMLLIAALLICLVAAFRGNHGVPWRNGIACGLAGSVTAMAFDLTLFKSFTLATLWWVFLLGLMVVREVPEEQPCAV